MKTLIFTTALATISSTFYVSDLRAEDSCNRMCGKYCCDKLIKQSDNVYYDSVEDVTYTINGNTVKTNETTTYDGYLVSYKEYQYNDDGTIDSSISHTIVSGSYDQTSGSKYVYINGARLESSRYYGGAPASISYTNNSDGTYARSCNGYCTNDFPHATVSFVGDKVVIDDLFGSGSGSSYKSTYDKNGNLLEKAQKTSANTYGATTYYTYDEFGNQISSLTKNGLGNPTSSTNYAYNYDAAGHKIGNYNQETLTYVYNQDGTYSVKKSDEQGTCSSGSCFNGTYAYSLLSYAANGDLLSIGSECNSSYGNCTTVEVPSNCRAATNAGACTKCNGESFRLNDGECDRIRYTPAEAAEVLKDTDNEIIMTFKVNR